MTSLLYSLTVHHHPHIPEKTVDDLERLRCSYPSFILGEPIQPLEYRLDVFLSKKSFNKFFYVVLESSNNSVILKTDLLDFPCLICLVTNARVESSSTSILTIVSVIPIVGGILV